MLENTNSYQPRFDQDGAGGLELYCLVEYLRLYKPYGDCLLAGGQRAQRWPPAGPPKYAHLAPEGVSGQNFGDFRILTGLIFELTRSDFQYS